MARGSVLIAIDTEIKKIDAEAAARKLAVRDRLEAAIAARKSSIGELAGAVGLDLLQLDDDLIGGAMLRLLDLPDSARDEMRGIYRERFPGRNAIGRARRGRPKKESGAADTGAAAGTTGRAATTAAEPQAPKRPDPQN